MNVADWLQRLGLERYEDAYRANDITGAVLPTLTTEDLRDLGFASVGRRRQLRPAMREQRPACLSTPPPG